jgi:hypothetical protein
MGSPPPLKSAKMARIRIGVGDGIGYSRALSSRCVASHAVSAFCMLFTYISHYRTVMIITPPACDIGHQNDNTLLEMILSISPPSPGVRSDKKLLYLLGSY